MPLKGYKWTKKQRQNRSGKNNPSYKDGRTLKKYSCIDEFENLIGEKIWNN